MATTTTTTTKAAMLLLTTNPSPAHSCSAILGAVNKREKRSCGSYKPATIQLLKLLPTS